MKLEKYNFYCPKCQHQLSDSGTVRLETKRHNGDSGEMHLSASFGTYSYKHTPAINFEKNEKVDFFCPNCKTNLRSNDYPNFVLMMMRAENEFEFEILFSRKAGMHKTYIITEDGVESYGEDATDTLE